MGIPVLPESLRYPLVSFTRLRSLVISSEPEAVRQFVLEVARTLKTLEIEDYWKGELILAHFPRAGKPTDLKAVSTLTASILYDT